MRRNKNKIEINIDPLPAILTSFPCFIFILPVNKVACSHTEHVKPFLLQRFEHNLGRSEEHTSELQSRQYLVCRLLLEKKKKQTPYSLLSASFITNVYDKRYATILIL